MNDELHTLSGAYAVHALPYAEWVLFEEHLLACPRCGVEVRRLRETAARLAEAVAEPPPTGLRRRLLSAAHERRRPDAPRQERGQDHDDSPTIWHPRRERIPEAVAPEIRVTSDAGQVVLPLRSRRTRVAAALAAVSAAAAVVLGVLAFDARRELGEVNARNGELLAVLAAPDAETVRQPVTSGGTGTVVISRSRGRMVFASSDLPEPPRGRAYELWLMGPGGPRPAGLLRHEQGGMTTPVLLTPVPGDGHVALTVEPAGGSKKPTTPPILLTELPSA
ncbi:anti-sigma factor [Nonomuraea jiangxiensis]|uniref:Regulator of SigK n=1 Tax=Nonomuraea jiangxiensis TaxID=633440 RepID=A0A1G8WJV8_9ACTN|nr:anti-sigma factor [Nonomuraea jiangxiensis]SDJ78471.1 Anti-sigma-K factor rskA [Nonomuraea jiangxiensis]